MFQISFYPFPPQKNLSIKIADGKWLEWVNLIFQSQTESRSCVNNLMMTLSSRLLTESIMGKNQLVSFSLKIMPCFDKTNLGKLEVLVLTFLLIDWNC